MRRAWRHVPLSSEKNSGPKKMAEAVAKTKKSKYSTAWARIATVTTRRRGAVLSLCAFSSSRTGSPSADARAISVMVVSYLPIGATALGERSRKYVVANRKASFSASERVDRCTFDRIEIRAAPVGTAPEGRSTG